MFTSMKICYNINARFRVFKVFKKSQHSHGVFLLCADFLPNMTNYELKTGENPITLRAIKMFTAMKICYNTNARYRVFKDFK